MVPDSDKKQFADRLGEGLGEYPADDGREHRAEDAEEDPDQPGSHCPAEHCGDDNGAQDQRLCRVGRSMNLRMGEI